MQTNTTKAKLSEGRVVIGAIISEHSPGAVEILGKLGYDFIMMDCEHGSLELTQVEHLTRAAELAGITPLARVPDHEPSTLLRVLDRGVQGVIVPHVNTAAQATAVAQAARYYPMGKRGLGGGRAHDFNIGVTRDQGTAWINDNTLVIPMIEEVEAVDNLDAILAVPGCDVFHVAPSDLGQSMGNAPVAEVRKMIGQVLPRIRAAGKIPGIGGNAASDQAGVAEMIELGAGFVTVQSWQLLRYGAEMFRSGVEKARQTPQAAG